MAVRVPEMRDFVGWGIGVVSLAVGTVSSHPWWNIALFAVGGALLLVGLLDWLILSKRSRLGPATDTGDSITQTVHGPNYGPMIGKVGHLELHAPQPSVRLETVLNNEPIDGSPFYRSVVRVTLTAGYSLNGLQLEVEGTHLKHVSPQAAMANCGFANHPPTHIGFRIGAPLQPQYEVVIMTTAPDDIQVTATPL